MSRGVNKVILIGLYLENMSIPEIAESTGIHRSTVRHHLFKAGVLRSRNDALQIAAMKGRLGSGLRGKKRTFTDEHIKAISLSKIRHAEKNAKGVCVKPSGYVEYTRGENKGRMEHRVLMESLLGRKLSRCEHVHHIDGDRANNDPSNLKLMTASEHAAHHATENSSKRRRNENGTWA